MRIFRQQETLILVLTCTCLVGSTLGSPLALAQTGGSLDLRRNVIAGGGGSSTGSGNMRVDGTVGQPAAGKQMSGGTLTQVGGFWPTILGIASSLPVVQFSSSSFTVGEGLPRVDLTLTRSGDVTSTANVERNARHASHRHRNHR